MNNRLRLDTVGSFLPPERLLNARRDCEAGLLSRPELTLIEDECIRELVDREISAGLPEVTDGEFRRHRWDTDFWFGLGGIRCERIDSGHIYQAPPLFTDLLRFTGRISYNADHPVFEWFAFVQSAAGGRAGVRQTLPSPTNLFLEILSLGNGRISDLYPSPSDLLQDIAEAYRETILRLYELGCRHVQLDDTACARSIDNNYTKRVLQGGIDLIALQEELVGLLEASVRDLPADLEISLYLSGGDNAVPAWDASPRPDNIMPAVLSRVAATKFFLPFDPDREEPLEILRFVPAGRKVVLGLTDAHTPFESGMKNVHRAVELALRRIPSSCLSVSPKTGFKLSSFEGRGLTYESQWRMLSELGTALAGCIV